MQMQRRALLAMTGGSGGNRMLPLVDDARVSRTACTVTIRPGLARGPLLGGKLAVLTPMAG
jgi:hypothetical protein